jgi:hypothetical protein
MQTSQQLEKFRTWAYGTRRRCILVGVIGWGGLMALLFPPVLAVLLHQLQDLVQIYVMTVPLALAGGFIFGLAMWRKVTAAREHEGG